MCVQQRVLKGKNESGQKQRPGQEPNKLGFIDTLNIAPI